MSAPCESRPMARTAPDYSIIISNNSYVCDCMDFHLQVIESFKKRNGCKSKLRQRTRRLKITANKNGIRCMMLICKIPILAYNIENIALHTHTAHYKPYIILNRVFRPEFHSRSTYIIRR